MTRKAHFPEGDILDGKGSERLSRPLQPMPQDVRERIEARELMDHYQSRPAYQRNDYLMWIAKAKRPDTREKRIAQMLDELQAGGVYMRMKWNG